MDNYAYRPNSVDRQQFLTQPSSKLEYSDDGLNSFYMRENVEPIISPAIIYVLKEAASPDQIPLLFLNYFHEQLEDTASIASCKKSRLRNHPLAVRKMKHRRRSVNTMKVSLELASFLSKLLSKALTVRPITNVTRFFYITVKELHENQTITIPKHLHSVVERSNVNNEIEPVKQVEVMTLVYLLLGLSGSGKTTLVSVLKGQNNPKCKPSLGFLPVSLKYDKNITVKLCDVGGGKKMRAIWSNYYHEVHGVIYVVDSACVEHQFRETVSVATATLSHKCLQGKPLLVINNKVDEAGSRPSVCIRQELNLSGHQNARLIATSIHPSKSTFQGHPDPIIDDGLQWLIETSLASIGGLNERIRDDNRTVELLRIKKRDEKERRILKNSILKAFSKNSDECKDILQKEVAEEFLAHEIGLSGPILLPPQARQICALVGFQRLALMIIGGKINPKSGQKPWSWEDVFSNVQSIRAELKME